MLKYKDPTPLSLWICYSTLFKFFFNFPTMLRLILPQSLLWNINNSVGEWMNEWMNEWNFCISSFICHENTYLWFRLCQSDILIELIYFDVEKSCGQNQAESTISVSWLFPAISGSNGISEYLWSLKQW